MVRPCTHMHRIKAPINRLWDRFPVHFPIPFSLIPPYALVLSYSFFFVLISPTSKPKQTKQTKIEERGTYTFVLGVVVPIGVGVPRTALGWVLSSFMLIVRYGSKTSTVVCDGDGWTSGSIMHVWFTWSLYGASVVETLWATPSSFESSKFVGLGRCACCCVRCGCVCERSGILWLRLEGLVLMICAECWFLNGLRVICYWCLYSV